MLQRKSKNFKSFILNIRKQVRLCTLLQLANGNMDKSVPCYTVIQDISFYTKCDW
jgi:hypothetical protein